MWRLVAETLTNYEAKMPSAVGKAARNRRGADDDDVVVTGLSGRLPESDSIEEFAEQLFAGVDLVTGDGRRWAPGEHQFIYFHDLLHATIPRIGRHYLAWPPNLVT